MKSNREHSFDFELASIVGLEKAILLKNISYWSAENKRRNSAQYFVNDIWWTEESLSSLAAKYPYMKRASIGRWLNELHDLGWVLIVGTTGGKNRYAPGKAFDLWDKGLDWQSIHHLKPSQNKIVHLPSQNETPTVSEWDANRPKMGYTNIELNIESNIVIPTADKQPKAPKKNKSDQPALVHEMVSAFESEHKKHFKDKAGEWIGFTWQNKEFGALKNLKSEFAKRLQGRGADFSDAAILQSWAAFLQMAAKADPWILKNQFTPSKLWGDFQGIIQKIQSQSANSSGTKPMLINRSTTTSFGGDASKFDQKQMF